MREYETIFITSPELSEEDTDDVAAQMEILVRESGTNLQVEKWGKRRLAYEIDKHKDGYYYLFKMETDGEIVGELERRLRLEDRVIRYLTVRVDEEKRRARKLAESRGEAPPWERPQKEDEGEEE